MAHHFHRPNEKATEFTSRGSDVATIEQLQQMAERAQTAHDRANKKLQADPNNPTLRDIVRDKATTLASVKGNLDRRLAAEPKA